MDIVSEEREFNADVGQKWENILEVVQEQLQKRSVIVKGEAKLETNEPPLLVEEEAAKVESAVDVELVPQAEEEASVVLAEEGSAEPYEGLLELEIAPEADEQISNFILNLRQILTMQVVSFRYSTRGERLIGVMLHRPLPLLSMLKKMPLVAAAIDHGNKIRVVLLPEAN
jgi:hypothetical protein